MATRRGWRIAVAAVVAAAGGGAAWVCATTTPRPVHGWILTRMDGSMQAYATQAGEPIERWTVTSARNRHGSRRLPNRKRGSITVDDPLEFLRFDAVDSAFDAWLGRLGVAPSGARSYGGTAWHRIGPGGKFPAWTEFVIDAAELPADAVSDPALVGTWKGTNDDDHNTLRRLGAYELLPDGTLRLENLGRSGSAKGAGRWGRVGDVLFIEISASLGGVGPPLTRITLVIDPDLQSCRTLGGWTLRRVK